jgi:hypothetical protein
MSGCDARVLKSRVALLSGAGGQRALAVSVRVQGITGPKETLINGVYDPTSESCSGWPVYQKRGDPDTWLEWLCGKWIVKATADKGQAKGYGKVASDPASAPECVFGGWQVHNGSAWKNQPGVAVVDIAAEARAEVEVKTTAEAEEKNGRRRVRRNEPLHAKLCDIPLSGLAGSWRRPSVCGWMVSQGPRRR